MDDRNMPIKDYYFYKFLVNDQVFFKSTHCFALVNLKPIVPGHVLVVSNRVVQRLNDLNETESVDYMLTIQKVSKFIREHYKADALNIAIQDGFYAGQSVPHLHTHIIPRHRNNNYGDAIYDKIDQFAEDMKKKFLLEELSKMSKKLKTEDVDWVPHDDERHPRSPEVMKAEADSLREALSKFAS